MVAYFSSKLTKQVKATLAVALLMVSMLGTHWIGFAHSISHASAQQQSLSQASASEIASTFNHSSDACHLFDGLTLAGFIPGNFSAVLATIVSSIAPANLRLPIIAQATLAAYQSRAPPSFIL